MSSYPIYKLLDSGNFLKLEQMGDYKFVRPAAGAVWSPKLKKDQWTDIDAKFERFSDGKGKWTYINKKLPDSWAITWGNLNLVMRPTSFGHLGIFPEQAQNWMKINELSKKSTETSEFKVLNLFGYTGGSSVAAALAGSHVTHIDASKPSVEWARENAKLNGLDGSPIRWIVEDVQKYVEREAKRGSQYHGIILDPPSFGRGPKNQLWKIEDHLIPLLKELKQILSPDFRYILLSAHSQGYTPIALENILRSLFKGHKGKFISNEMTIKANSNFDLPSGASSIYINS